jgi:thiamine kinase-like enzyme
MVESSDRRRDAEGTAVIGAHALPTPSRPQSAAIDDDNSRIRSVLARIPDVDSVRCEIEALPGGLTNRNFRVSASGGRRLVVRLSSPQSSLLAIDREAEYANATAAAAAGVAPAVLAYAPEVGALAIEWIDGRTFEPADLDDGPTIARLAATCRQLHAGPRFASDFDMFVLQRRYLDLVITSGFRLPATYLDYMPQITVIRDAMAAGAGPTVPCHNDLLPANIIGAPDRLWFIDFEYAGNGDPCFELGNIASESRLSDDRLSELVTAYFGAERPAALARAQLFSLMSDFGWTLWASIQAATSDLDADFWSWGMAKYERAVERLRHPGLTRLITDVQQGNT